MPTCSTRTAFLLAACASALSAAGVLPQSAQAQVTAANTIAPANTVVAQPLPTVKPVATTTTPAQLAGSTPATVTTTATVTATVTTAKPKAKTKTTKAKSTSTATIIVTAPNAAALSVLAPDALAVEVPATDGAEVPVSTIAEAVSFSDPLADLAAAALDVIASGGAPASGGAVAASGQAQSNSAVVVAAPSAVQFAVTPAPVATVAPDPNVPRPPANLGSTSVIINTADLAEFVTGVAIAAPVSRESQAVLSSLPTVGSDRYSALLKAMAKVVGSRTTTDPAALEAVWARTDPRRMKAILSAMAQVGTRYHYTGNKPGGFDCSGLTSYAWSQAGVKIPRTSTQQLQSLPRKAAADLLPGDIVWHPGHVSMYLGADQAVVDAPQTGKTVLVKKANARSWISFVSPL